MIVFIPHSSVGKRIDTAIKDQLSDLSRTKIQEYIKSGSVSCDGKISNDISKKITSACTIEINIKQNLNPTKIEPENIKLEIVFEDEHIIILNKPAGLVCHPAPGNRTGTLVNALMFRFPNLSDAGGNDRLGIIHRLDKNTSGLMIVAKNNKAHYAFAELFSKHKGDLIRRKYTCFVFGVPKEKQGKIENLIARNPRLRQQFMVSDVSGKSAITFYSTLNSLYFSSTKAISKISCELLTGRTHQIRVHMKHLGNPIIGDETYGKSKIEACYPEIVRSFSRQALHSSFLSFKHPFTGKTLLFQSELPDDMEKLNDLFV